MLKNENTIFYIETIFLLNEAPSKEDNTVSEKILSSMYHIANGNSGLRIEFTRVCHNKRISHVLIAKTQSTNEKNCRDMNKAFVESLKETLLKEDFIYTIISKAEFDDIRKKAINNTAQTWMVKKTEQPLFGTVLQKQYLSTPLIYEINHKSIYQALEDVDCVFSITTTPTILSEHEKREVQRKHQEIASALHGDIPNRVSPEHIVNTVIKQSESNVTNLQLPFVKMQILISGEISAVSRLISRINACVKDENNSPIKLQSFPVKIGSNGEITNQGTLLDKVTILEAAKVMQFPSGEEMCHNLKLNKASFLEKRRPVASCDENNITIGLTSNGEKVSLSFEDLQKHLCVLGKSGVGKTSLLLNIINDLKRKGINTTIIDPVKNEYRQLITDGKTKIFCAENTAASLYTINPFIPPQGISLSDYKQYLFIAFTSAFSMPDPLPSLFSKAINEAYYTFGWTDSSKHGDKNVQDFALPEFIKIFERILQESNYSGEVKANMISGGIVRLNSLIERSRRTFECCSSTNIEDLVNGSTVIEFSKLEGESKILVTALTMIAMLSHFRATRRSGSDLQNVIIFDEAHCFLDGNSITEEGVASSNTMRHLLVNFISEMRALGVAVIIGDQTPSRIGSLIMDNVYTNICFRLSGAEAKEASKSINITETESRVFPMLETGELIIANDKHTQVAKTIFNPHGNDKVVHDLDIEKRMKVYHQKNAVHPYFECNLIETCTKKECDYKSREQAQMLSVQFLSEVKNKITNTEKAIEYLLCAPKFLKSKAIKGHRLTLCLALHIAKKLALDKNIYLPHGLLSEILNKHFKED